ncbi:MAG: hypothetical protein GY849_02250 [Deltaproteobacteria bacterium]|nr:hypothetical protein [Deltaproteobacteria bacterium]
MKKVKFIGSIPLCPNCKNITIRRLISSEKTSMYFEPMFDEKGNNINPDKNIKTVKYKCECKHEFSIKGNSVDGFYYNN